MVFMVYLWIVIIPRSLEGPVRPRQILLDPHNRQILNSRWLKVDRLAGLRMTSESAGELLEAISAQDVVRHVGVVTRAGCVDLWLWSERVIEEETHQGCEGASDS
jgi:hypothetical protein